MAIDQDIAAIRQAMYGKDVREAIAHGIEQCYSDVTTSKTSAEDATANATQAASSANTAAANANQKAQAADTAATNANQKAQAADTAAKTIDTKVETKVSESVGSIVLVQDTQPTEEDNKIWIKPESEEYKVPTWEEFQELSAKVDELMQKVN